jgi:hypothetical protein
VTYYFKRDKGGHIIMTKEQRLDLRLVNDVYQEQNKRRKVDIPVTIEDKTQMAVLEIDEVFSPSKIRNCVEEFISRIDAVRKMNEHRFQEVIESFMLFMLIKHFTSFPSPETYKEQVVVLNMLMETGLLYRIYAEFESEEVAKVSEEIGNIAEVLEQDVDEFVAMAQKMGLGADKEEGGAVVEKLQ